MYELSAKNDNIILFDKVNQKHYILDDEDVDQIVDNNNKLRSDEVIEKYLKFKTEPIVVQQQLKTADVKAEYEAMRELYEPKVSTQVIDSFIDKFKLSNDELRKLEAFPDSKTIDTFNRDEVEKNNMKKEFKLMFEKLKKDTNIKTDPFLYLKFYFGTKIIKTDNVFIQQQLSNLLKEPWKYADTNYITQQEIDNLKRNAPYKNLASLVFSVRRPVFDGINFMKIISLLKIYLELKRKYFNHRINETKYRSEYTNYNKNDKYLNFNIYSKKNKKISFSVKNRILYIFNIKLSSQIKSADSLKKFLKSITPKVYALLKYLLISEPIENQYKVTINLFGDFNDEKDDETIFTDNYLIYKIEKINNRVEKQQKKTRNTLWDKRVFEQTIEDFKRYVRESDTDSEITNRLIELMNSNPNSSSDSTQSDDSSDDGFDGNIEKNNLFVEKETSHKTVSSTTSNDNDDNEIEVKEPSNDNEIDVDKLNETLKQYNEKEKEEIKQRNQKRIQERENILFERDKENREVDGFPTFDAFVESMKNAKIQDEKDKTGNKLQREVYSYYINPMIDSELEAEGRLKLLSSGWTDKTLTRIDNLLTQLKKSSGYNIPRQYYALGWTDKTLTRIDNLLTQLK